jgi:hypothetical protein
MQRSVMQRCSLWADIECYVQSEAAEAIPWLRLMLKIVPFSPAVCIAGSVGTWLAEYGIHKSRPLWDPSDIDVFVMVQTELEYANLIDEFVSTMSTTITSIAPATPFRTSAYRKYGHIFIVQWWIWWNGIEVMCPEISLIHSPVMLFPNELMAQFDIDICKVAVHVCDLYGSLYFTMSTVVHNHIQQRDMHCVMRKDPSSACFHYPMQRTLDRIGKYVGRGYRFRSLQFVPTQSELSVADFERVWLPRQHNCN